MPNGTTPVISPDGTIGDIPTAKLQDAVKAGFKIATDIYSPDGTRGTVPIENLHDAVSKGFSLIPSEKEAAAYPPQAPVNTNMQTSAAPALARAVTGTLPALGGMLGGAATAPGVVSTPVGIGLGTAAGAQGQFLANRALFGDQEPEANSTPALVNTAEQGVGAAALTALMNPETYSAAKNFAGRFSTADKIPVPFTHGAVTYQVRPSYIPSVQEEAEAAATKKLAQREAEIKLGVRPPKAPEVPEPPEPTPQEIAEKRTALKLAIRDAEIKAGIREAPAPKLSPEESVKIAGNGQFEYGGKQNNYGIRPDNHTVTDMRTPNEPNSRNTIQFTDEEIGDPAKVLAKMDAKRAEDAALSSGAKPDDLISRTKRIVVSGAEPTEADLKRAGDLTQAPIEKLQQLAKFGDRLAQNELNRRMAGPGFVNLRGMMK